MELPISYNYSLQFKFTGKVKRKMVNKWNALKELCENGNNEEIVTEWLDNCQLPNNKKASFINNLQGGILFENGNSLQFRYSLSETHYTDKCIVLNFIIVNDQLSNILTLNDIIDGFIIMANKHIGCECDDEFVTGTIVITDI